MNVMKYAAIVFFAAISGFGLSSCGNGQNEETVTDSTMMTDEYATQGAMDGNTVTYYDLTTGNALHRDEASGRYVDEGGAPSDFYVDVQAADTFYGATGQNVNNAMVNENNTWRVDESRIKITENKMVIEDDEAKLKVKADKAKLITEDQKIKAKTNSDGETEVKVKER